MVIQVTILRIRLRLEVKCKGGVYRSIEIITGTIFPFFNTNGASDFS